MSSEEFSEWTVYAMLEPFDEERMDTRFSFLAANVMNTVRDRKKKRTPFGPWDFPLYYGDTPRPERPPQTWQQQKSMGQMLASMFNMEASKAKVKKPSRRANG